MTTSSPGHARYVDPFRVYLSVLAIVFVNEFLVMLLLPLMLPADGSRWVVATVDASLLTLLLLPFLWMTVIRPLRTLASLRARLLEHFVKEQEEERRRIAYDLHDEIGQSLTSVMIGLRTLDDCPNPATARQRVADLRGIVSQSVQEVRRIANGLRPAALDHLGLVAAVEQLAEEFRETRGFDIKVATDLDRSQRLTAVIETAIYRIVQEALTNAARHAAPKRVEISLSAVANTMLLDIVDDGKGIAEGRERGAPADGKHLGLAGMAERTAMLDGKFSIDTQRGRGTRVHVVLPLRRSTS